MSVRVMTFKTNCCRRDARLTTVAVGYGQELRDGKLHERGRNVAAETTYDQHEDWELEHNGMARPRRSLTVKRSYFRNPRKRSQTAPPRPVFLPVKARISLPDPMSNW